MKRLTVILIVAVMAVVSAHASKPGCIQSSQHYEGHPKPHTYVALTLEALKKEEFPLKVGETRWVKYSFAGEKLLFYSVNNREE